MAHFLYFNFFQGLDGLGGDKGDDGEAGQPVSLTWSEVVKALQVNILDMSASYILLSDVGEQSDIPSLMFTINLMMRNSLN